MLSLASSAALSAGPTQAAEALPLEVKSQSAAAITTNDATLEASISAPAGGAYYQFQVAENEAELAAEMRCPVHMVILLLCRIQRYEDALPIDYLDEDQDPASVSLDLAKAGMTLKPNTTYHYRVILTTPVLTEDTIEWKEPIVVGPAQTFTTQPLTTPLEVKSESVAAITARSATLEATISAPPGGAYYQFQLAPDPDLLALGMRCPSATFNVSGLPCIGPKNSLALPIGFVPEGETPVSLEIAKADQRLWPNTAYRYRVVLTTPVQTESAIEWGEPAAFGPIQTFTTPALTNKLEVKSQSAAAITTNNAKLEASISAPAGGAYYQFQVAENEADLAPEMRCPPIKVTILFCTGTKYEDVLPIGYLSEDQDPASVSLDLAKAGMTLKPNTTYHYRLILTTPVPTEYAIEWKEPIVVGPVQTFTTQAPPKPLEVKAQSVAAITARSATLEATISAPPGGAYYQFQLAPDNGPLASEMRCPSSTVNGLPCVGPLGSLALPIGFVPEGETPVSLDLAAVGALLSPSTTYHYRVVVTTPALTEDTVEWQEPMAVGAEQSFVTSRAADPPPSNAFSLGKLSRSLKRGAARLEVSLPGPGTLTLHGHGLRSASATVADAGLAYLAIVPTKRVRALLRRRHSVALTVAVTFTPVGGDAATRDRRVTLRMR